MNNGYIEVLAKDHPGAKANGYIFQHRLVAEQVIGRMLTEDEVVHHVDENRTNNVPSNIWVFATNADHSRYHMTGIAVQRSDGIYESPANFRNCVMCSKPCRNRYCSGACRGLSQRRVARPSEEELGSLLRSNSMVSLGKRYGVSDNTVRRWAKAYGLI